MGASQTAEDIVKFLIFDVVVGGVEAYLFTIAPWLRLPVVYQVFHFTLTKLAGLVFKELDKLVIFTVINVQTEAQANAFKEATARLRSAKGEDLEKAKAEFRARLRDLVQLRDRMRPS